MERKTFFRKWVSALVLGSLLLLCGCGKEEQPRRFGNQERLWQMVVGQEKREEPVELGYAKETPALYRDASMGKADPSFVPAVAGG